MVLRGEDDLPLIGCRRSFRFPYPVFNILVMVSATSSEVGRASFYACSPAITIHIGDSYYKEHGREYFDGTPPPVGLTSFLFPKGTGQEGVHHIIPTLLLPSPPPDALDLFLIRPVTLPFPPLPLCHCLFCNHLC